MATYGYGGWSSHAHAVLCTQVTGSALEAGAVLSTCASSALGAVKGGWLGIASGYSLGSLS